MSNEEEIDNNLQRDFKGVWIPKELWLGNELSTYEKLILLEIDSLDSNEEGCYARNEHFAKMFGCTIRTVTNAINKLQKLGYIEIINFNGRNRFIKSRLEMISMQTRKNFYAAWKKFPGTNISNTLSNTDNKKKKDISKDISKKEKKFIKPTVEQIQEYCNERNNDINAEMFYDFYESKGWLIGKNKMKDWKASVRTWEKKKSNNKTSIREKSLDFLRRKRQELDKEEQNE